MRTPSTQRAQWRIWPALLAAVALTGCSEVGPGGHAGRNVVFIVADTLRADHLGSWGYERETSPFLDSLARSHVQFVNARSQASCTFPSVNSMLTSRNPLLFTDPETRPGIPETVPSLAVILEDHGYRTAAVSASPIVRKSPSKHNPVGGFGRGFEIFDEECQWHPSSCVTGAALNRLAALEPPFFLYLHYMDPHDPYRAMPEQRGLFARPYAGQHGFIAEGDPNPIDAMIRRGEAEQILGAADVEHLIDLYDEEIYSFDVGLRQLFGGLAERGLLESSLIVVASDHGEAFFEHGYVKHCFTVYDNETRVPLVLRLPRAAGPVRRTASVQNLDIVPTLLDYLGIDAEPYGLEGHSLRPLIESPTAPPRLAFSAMGPYRSVTGDRYKVTLDYRRRSYGLYDLVADPEERHDLSAVEREVFYRLLRELKTWTDGVETGTAAERLRRAQEIEDELRALGYLGG